MSNPEPNSRVVAATTAGIARNMNLAPQEAPPGEPNSGGGDQNGTAATSILFHQAGTGIGRLAVARLPQGSGNYTGIV